MTRWPWALIGILLLPALGHAEQTRLLLTDPVATPGMAGLRLTSFHGDGFWNDGRTLASQSDTLLEERLELFGASTFRNGLYIGGHVPFVHRRIDQLAPNSFDAAATGVGDAEFAFGWRTESDSGTQLWGVEIRWKVPSGTADLSIEDVARGSPALAPLGTGGHDVDLWLGGRKAWSRFGLAYAIGYRARFASHVAFLVNSALSTRIEPNDRIQVRGTVQGGITEKVWTGASVEAMHEVVIGGFQNDSHAWWLEAFLEGRISHWRFRALWETPLWGKNYPDLPLDVANRKSQFVERDPLLGQRIGLEWTWLLQRDRTVAP